VNWGGAQFFGGLDLGSTFWGPNTITPDELVTVEIRFHTNIADGQNAYMYLRGGTPSYGYVSYAQQYFTVWDVTSSPERQIAVAYVEQAGNAANNNLWQPTASNADREYLFIFNTDYTAAADAFYTSRNLNTQGDEFPTLYAMWPLQRGTMPFNPQDGQVFRITPNFANTNVDAFTFSTSGMQPTQNSASLDQASVDKAGVFPNPYYAFNAAETNRFARFVTFNNLPPKATIRIFNLAGQLVRRLDKDDTSQFLRWDLANQANFPVASGLYVAHLEMTLPTDNSTVTKVLKVAIIQEQEILNSY
jgi:hypothetical protein